MDDRELIAAILKAGMLPTVPKPAADDGEAILRAVGHAIGLCRSAVEGLGVDPFRGTAGTRYAAAVAR